jgi:GT2 family glycosyltransferase
MSDITVVVSTFREGYFGWMLQLLDALKNQTLKDFEVLIVVNSNHRYFLDLQNTVKKANFPYKTKIIFNPVDNGIAHARNIGLKNASTKYIAYTDDDAIPHSYWLKTIYDTFQTSENAAVVTGPVIPWWSSAVQELSTAFPKELYWIIGCTFLDTGVITEVRNGFASNLTLNREFAIKCGGFNEAFGYNLNNPMAGEEPEICFRLKKMGKTTLWNPESVVFHRITSNRVRLQALLGRAFLEGKSKAYLRRAIGSESMGTETAHLQAVLQAILTAKDLRSKSLLITTTLAVFSGYFRYFKKSVSY